MNRPAHSKELLSTEANFYDELERLNLYPLWRQQPISPHKRALPYLWKWPLIREQIQRAADVVSTKDVERRVLTLGNPGLEGGIRHATAPNLIAAIQMILPGEIAIAHQHTPSALRIILEGEGSYTCTNGERCWMEPGDLILTPAWSFHDHENKGDGPMIWLDGLDVPLIASMDTFFFSRYPGNQQQPRTETDEASLHRFGTAGMRPADFQWEKPYSPLTKYPLRKTIGALNGMLDSDANPFDDFILEYFNPHTGGPVMPSIACYAQKLRAGYNTKRHRHSSSVIYNVFRGQGCTTVENQRFDWSAGDIFVLPGWHWHEHGNSSKVEDAILISYSDRPLLKTLGIHFEEQDSN